MLGQLSMYLASWNLPSHPVPTELSRAVHGAQCWVLLYVVELMPVLYL
jgi:hypothetical protein